jgi:hypothetical protein
MKREIIQEVIAWFMLVCAVVFGIRLLMIFIEWWGRFHP